MKLLRLEMQPGSAAAMWIKHDDGSWSCGNVSVRRDVIQFADRWFVWVTPDGQKPQIYHAPRNSDGYSTEDVAKNAAYLMSLSHRCR